jgi:hypothetical protein
VEVAFGRTRLAAVILGRSVESWPMGHRELSKKGPTDGTPCMDSG